MWSKYTMKARALAQLVDLLLCKHEVWNSIPSTHIKRHSSMHMQSQYWGAKVRQSPGAC